LATPDATDPSKFSVVFGGSKMFVCCQFFDKLKSFLFLVATVKFWVIDTDYVSYSLVYSCTQLPILSLIIGEWKKNLIMILYFIKYIFLFILENAWILSRNPTLDFQTIRNLKSKLSAVNSPTFLFISTEQINCDHNLNNFWIP
jgi:hypothetical protein